MRSTTYVRGLALLLTAVALPAGADDRKAFPGQICKSNFADISYGLYGVFAAEDDVVVYCQLVRDQMLSSSQFSNALIEVFNDDSSELICEVTALSEDPGGSEVDFVDDSTTATGQQQLDSFSGLETSDGQEGSYVVDYFLDQDDAVNSIYFKESSGQE